MMQRRTALRLLAASGIGVHQAGQAYITGIHEAINKAGRQRMLSQRISKAWLALVRQVDLVGAQEVLDRSIAQFDRQLVELKAFAPSEDIRATYRSMELVWAQHKDHLLGAPPNLAAAPTVLHDDAKLLAVAHKGTLQYEQLLGQPIGKLVNLAGRQRMLSQRMAKFYLAATLQLDAASAKQEVALAKQEFERTQEYLRRAPESSDKTRELLHLADVQWVFLDSGLKHLGSDAPVRKLSDVFVSSENLLTVMDQITGLYAAQRD